MFGVQGRLSRTLEMKAWSCFNEEMANRKQKTILFLCTGNYYRSRFAEVLFASVASKMGLSWRAVSRGLALERGVGNVGPMATSAIRALEAMKIRDAERCGRLPTQVTLDDLEAADVIVALKHAEHLPLLQQRFPAFVEKAEFWHIDDAPEALALIESKMLDLMARLLGGGGEAPRQDPIEPEEKSHAPRKPVTLKVGRETAGRRGKGVTTIFDTSLDGHALLELAARLKQRCGTGGTVKDGRIEIQGDQRERVALELEKLGYKVRRVGG